MNELKNEAHAFIALNVENKNKISLAVKEMKQGFYLEIQEWIKFKFNVRQIFFNFQIQMEK